MSSSKPISPRRQPLASGPLLAGCIGASVAVLLPPGLGRAIAGLIPERLVNGGVKLVPLSLQLALLLVPDRVFRIVGGFVIAYLGKKYISWLRYWMIRQLLKYQGWIRSANWKTKIWSLVLAIVEGRGPFQMFEFQKCLPKLPLPELNKTLDKWLEVSRVLVSESQHELTREAVEEFRQNEGPKLQAFLQQKYEKTENWLYDYWLFAAYLSYREPLMFNSNYFTTSVLPEFMTTDQLTRAATVIAVTAQFEKILSSNEYEPVMMQNLVPLCMHGYNFIYNTVRTPGEHMDTPMKYANQRHIVVIRKGLFFRLDVDAPDGKGNVVPLSAEELKLQLQEICNEADMLDQDLPVASLTAQNRTVWAKQRLMLIEKNKETLDTIEKCMFIAVLDERSPKDASELGHYLMTGTGYDRWFDKCFSHITFANAYCGSNIEHSVLDAMVFVTMNEYVMANERYENGDVVRELNRRPRHLPSPKRLKWDLTGLESAISTAMKSFQEISDNADIKIIPFKYGKGFMKKCRLSPDGYIQMALQLAYSRLHKETAKTYEPATSRLYALGRTETIHPASTWSVQWVKSMDDPVASSEEKKTLLKKAIKHQNQFRVDATVGEGCDRHLLGLLCASRELGMDFPKIFRDEAWTKNFKLSTSQTPNRIYEVVGEKLLNYPMCNGGFGPSCHDGYGISYVIYGDSIINITIASWHNCKETDSAKLAQEIDRALDDMKNLYSSN